MSTYTFFYFVVILQTLDTRYANWYWRPIYVFLHVCMYVCMHLYMYYENSAGLHLANVLLGMMGQTFKVQ